MKNLFNWICGGVICICIFVMLMLIARDLGRASREDAAQKEECIILRYQKEPEKFLDRGCHRYVRWNQ